MISWYKGWKSCWRATTLDLGLLWSPLVGYLGLQSLLQFFIFAWSYYWAFKVYWTWKQESFSVPESIYCDWWTAYGLCLASWLCCCKSLMLFTFCYKLGASSSFLQLDGISMFPHCLKICRGRIKFTCFIGYQNVLVEISIRDLTETFECVFSYANSMSWNRKDLGCPVTSYMKTIVHIFD